MSVYVLVVEDVCTQKHKTLSSALRAAEKMKGLSLCRVNIGLPSKRDAYEHDAVIGLSAFTDRMKHPNLLILVFVNEEGVTSHGRVMWRPEHPDFIRSVLTRQK